MSAFTVDWAVDSAGALAINYCFPAAIFDDTSDTAAPFGVPSLGADHVAQEWNGGAEVASPRSLGQQARQRLVNSRVCGGITRIVKTQLTRIATNSAGGLSRNNSGYMWDNSTVCG